MIGMLEAGWRQWGKAAVEGPRRFCRASRASVSLETVCYLCFSIGIVAGVFEVMNALFVGDVLDRAAQAVARDNSLQLEAAADKEQLLARAWKAIGKEVGDRLDPDLVEVGIKVYDDPSTMLRGEESTGDNSMLGGDPGNMVVVRLRYVPDTPLARLREVLQAGESDSLAFQALAVARNERTIGFSEPPAGDLLAER